MYLGYNTNGLVHHEPLAALELVAEMGYQGVALTLDHYLLNPYDSRWPEQLKAVARALERLGLQSVVETGARFLLDPRRKHQPTLLSPSAEARARRLEFLRHALRVAEALGSQCVSLWSGAPEEPAEPEVLWGRLVSGLEVLLKEAQQRGVPLGLEPEPGMWVATLEHYRELKHRLPSPWLRLTLDVGHVFCQQEGPVPERIRLWGSELVNVHIEDMRQGVHEHLLFGEGQMEFEPIVDALGQVGYRGGVFVELSRHSHMAPQALRHSHRFLAPLVQAANRRYGL